LASSNLSTSQKEKEKEKEKWGYTDSVLHFSNDRKERFYSLTVGELAMLNIRTATRVPIPALSGSTNSMMASHAHD
jgi:hypothetical protein